MNEPHVPWRDRSRRPLRGVSEKLAAAASLLYRVAAPVVRRIPGPLLAGAAVSTCLAVALTAWLMRDVQHVQEALICESIVQPGEWMTLDQTRTGRDRAGVTAPVMLLWALQSALLRDLIGLAGVVGLASLMVIFGIWWERKVSAFIQNRMGPMRVGGWHGWSQSIADSIKLLAKEDLVPSQADRSLFRLAPYLTLVPVLCAFVVLPFGATWVLRELDVALILILALVGVDIIGVLIAGWASNNKWSVYGAMREACQVVSYEVPMTMALLIPVMIVGSISLREIATQQSGGWTNWLAWHSPWSFGAMLVYFVASLAACKRAPFDLPEAESELVAGFHTEYSGFRWSVFFFAEYNAMFIVSGVLVLLFLGGWDSPWAGLAPTGWASSPSLIQQLAYGVLFGGPLWFILKTMLLVTAQMWLRWTLPRLRIDQVLYSCMQVILPLTMILLLLSSAWELFVRNSAGMAGIAAVIRYALASIGAAATIAIIGVAAAGLRSRRALVGPLAVDRPIPGA
jgi:NADH-quinone oxidoreductase subunit H